MQTQPANFTNQSYSHALPPNRKHYDGFAYKTFVYETLLQVKIFPADVFVCEIAVKTAKAKICCLKNLFSNVRLNLQNFLAAVCAAFAANPV